ncbi:TPA: phage tail protein [Streptococcus suis]|nr:phage tail protein [Streptococcus suis]HEM5192381.1 phage tail protein [Streptococcus suis]
MLTFLDHKGNEIGALTTFNYTNSVNGERSLSGTVHGNLEIEKGWGVRFEDEYYKVIYAKPKSLGKINIVQFDAVHQFFWDFDKSSVYSELDGSYPFQTFLDHIFNGSGYRYNLEVEVGSLRKQNFGLKKRLELFNDLIKHAGVEFQVRGKVVRILERTGTDLSTVVRKKLNLNDLSIEKRIGDFITYQKGLGAWHDENDPSKGRLEVEYVSPLAAIYGCLEGEPYVDERFTIAENFLGVLKKSVEDSYSISVQLAMEDLQKAGYQYTRPLAGDYITVIDEDINFKERVRIVSFETKYDIKGQVIDHTVTCNDIGSVKKQSVGYSSLKSSVANVSKETESAIQTANRALVSANGKTTVYFGTEFPQDIPKGTLTKGDTLHLEVGDTTKTYYWNGAEWLEPPVVNDVEAFKESINTEIAQVNESMEVQAEEHDRQVADILSKTQSVESLANQAKSDAASAVTTALQSKDEAIADARAQVSTVSQALNTAKTDLQNQVNAIDAKAVKVQSDANALRTDLNLQASKILEQAQAQTALTNRVTTVETLADGTRSTVAELSKTVSKATGDIASVTSRTKTVEDTLSQTRTQYDALTQTVNAQTGQITSINQKTAQLQSGIDGVTQRFENLQVGGNNLLKNTKDFSGEWDYNGHRRKIAPWKYNGLSAIEADYPWEGLTQLIQVRAGEVYTFSAYVASNLASDSAEIYIHLNNYRTEQMAVVDNYYRQFNMTATFQRVSITFKVITDGYIAPRIERSDLNGILYFAGMKLERGTIATDWSPAPEDQQSYADTKIAEYKNTVDGRFATIQASVDSKANQVDFQAVKETAQLYERIIGSTETGIKDKVARMVMADSLFLTEVKDRISGTATQVSQLSNSWAVQNLTGAGTVLNQINLLANGTNRIDGRLTHITGQTLIDNGVINNAMIGELDAGKITTGTLDAARIKVNSIDGSKLVFDQAFVNKMTANEALFKQLFAQSAFITSVQAVAVSAKQIVGGIAKALNGGMDVNFDESKINFYTNVAAIRRIYTGHPTQFIKFETEGNYSRTIIGSNRNGGEVFNSATFAGIVVENTNNINTEDNVRLYGDNTLFRHAQGDVGWNINSVTQRIIPANINAESEIWSKHFVAPDKNSKPVRLDTAVAALWDIWNHIIYNNFEFNEALRTHIKARRDNWKFELNL